MSKRSDIEQVTDVLQSVIGRAGTDGISVVPNSRTGWENETFPSQDEQWFKIKQDGKKFTVTVTRTEQ